VSGAVATAPGVKLPHLSHSQLTMLSRCGEQYRRRYIEGEKIPPAIAMLVGRAVDESVTDNLTTKIEHGTLLPLEQVRAKARDTFSNTWAGEGVFLTDEDVALGPARVKGEAVDKSVRLAELHARQVAPGISPTAVQRRWEVSLEKAGYAATLVGVLDIQEGSKRIRDTKTSGKSPSEDQADKSDQLTLYALGAKVIDGAIPDELSLDYLVDTKTPKVVQLVSKRTEADFGPVLRRVERALEVIQAGAFTPANPETDWWCSKSSCGYWASCPFVRRGATVTVPR
jgi:hypothetical protein